jgi:hypothetical protein
MPDNKKKTKADGKLIAAKQPYEVAYVAKKANVSVKAATTAIKAAGPSRKKVMEKLKKK